MAYLAEKINSSSNLENNCKGRRGDDSDSFIGVFALNCLPDRFQPSVETAWLLDLEDEKYLM